MTRHHLIVLLAAGVALAIAGCSNNPIGIFESIEREREILDDRNLPNELNVAEMIRVDDIDVGATEPIDRYFAATGALYFRATDDSVVTDRPGWEVAAAPGTNFTALSVVAVDFGSGTRVFATFTSQSAAESGVYEINIADPTVAPTAVLTAASAGVDSIGRLFVVEATDGTHLLASIESNPDPDAVTHELFASADGASFSAVAGTAGQTPFIDVASDGANVAYLRANAVLIDTDVLAGAAPSAASTGIASGDRYTGIHHDFGSGANRLWLADDSGFLYSSDDFGASWVRTPAAIEINTNNDDPVPFTDFASVRLGPGGEWVLYVGTRGHGYRVINGAATATAASAVTDNLLPSPDVDGSNYQASELAGAVVQTFFVDPTLQDAFDVPNPSGTTSESGFLVFAGTSNQGLWRALAYDGPIQWVRE